MNKIQWNSEIVFKIYNLIYPMRNIYYKYT